MNRQPVSWTGDRLRRWWHAVVVRSVDHDEAIAKISEDAGWSAHFAFMTVMSAGIAVLGLLLSSPAVVIGAMLISPLMGPIIGLGFALAMFDSVRMRRSLSAVLGGVVLAIGICTLIVWLSPLQTVTEEIASRTRPNLFDLLVALFSGLAGTYAMIRGRHGTIVGVAIATALMPPIAVVGFALATGNWTVLAGSFLLFFTNLMTIAAAAALLARIYGFASGLSPRQTRLQAGLMVAALVALAVPLAFSLNRIAWEALASRQAREMIETRFGKGARLSDIEIDYHRNPIEISATVLTPVVDAKAELELTARLASQLGRSVELAVDQVRIGSGDTEAIELAAAKSPQSDPNPARQNQRMAERLALVAGVGPDDVLIDTAHKRTQVRARPLPGATLESYRALEGRVAASAPSWTIVLIPPAAALPTIAFDKDEPDSSEDSGLATATWAAKRLNLPIGVAAARRDDADRIVAALIAAGVDARRVSGDSPRTGASLEWLSPGAGNAPQ